MSGLSELRATSWPEKLDHPPQADEQERNVGEDVGRVVDAEQPAAVGERVIVGELRNGAAHQHRGDRCE